MPTNTEVSRVQIEAAPARVWEVLTRPDLVKLWQYGSDLTTDWQVGGPIRFRNEWEGNVFEQWGTVLEVLPNKRIRYSLFFPRPGLEDKPENYFVMEYWLEETGGGTLVTISKEDSRPGVVTTDSEVESDSENPILKALKDVAEG